MREFNNILNKFKLIIYAFLLVIISVKCAKTAEDLTGPCENFYEYACRNYTKDNPSPFYSEITQKLDFDINMKLIKHLHLLKYQIHNENQTYYDKMGLYLQSCQREKQRNLRKYLEEIKPSDNLNWPLWGYNREQWLEEDRKFDLWTLLGQLQSYGFNNVIFKQEIVRNKDKTLNIWLTSDTLEDEEDNLTKTKIWQFLLMTLGIEDIESNIQQLIKTDLEWQHLRQKYAFNMKSKTTNWKNIAQLYPELNLKLYFQNLLGAEFYNLQNITIENPKYFEYLNQKLWTAEELEHLCNYLMIQFLYYLAKDSTNGFEPRECIKDLRKKFDVAVNYILSNFPYFMLKNSYKILLDKMGLEIMQTMAKFFKHNHLKLSQKQINYLENKLKEIYINVGNTPMDANYTIINKYYQDLGELDANNYYKNHLLLLQHRFRQSLNYAANQTHFLVTDNLMGSVSSPYYVPQQNMIVIPFGSLQSPLFSYSQTPLQQLSLFGFVLAHELTHAFDTTGLNYDKQGLLSSSGSDIMDHANFLNSLECMQRQQPTEEIDERIADLFAVRVVYSTYFEYYSKQHKGDWRQEFFMSLAQFFCGKDNITFIEHDADNIRLHQILMNFQPFSQAFGCAEGSPMNPKTKCRLY